VHNLKPPYVSPYQSWKLVKYVQYKVIMKTHIVMIKVVIQ